MLTKTTETEFSPKAFRRALGNFATGVTIITAVGPNGEKVGVTASSFNSLSMDPPLILWSSIKGKPSTGIFEDASHFAVNILALDQMELSNHFARQQKDKFAGIDWEEGLNGAPLLPNCAGRFQCETYSKLDGGDHWIFVGKVVAFDDFGRPPLCFHQGAYSMAFSHPSVNSEQDHSPSIRSDGQMDDHLFFMMLQAIRAYQGSYSPKLKSLGVNLIESRTLIALNDLPGSSAEEVASHVNAPVTEVREAILNLTERSQTVQDETGFTLTETGQSKAKDIWVLAKTHEKEVFSNFDQAEIKTFADTLQRLIDV